MDGSTLHVDYAYDDATGTYNGITSVFTKGMRPKSIKYPDGRLVHYTYGTGGGLDDALSRVAAIYNDNGGSPGSTAYAAYKYAGDGRIVQEAFAEPDLPEGPPSGKLTHIGAGNKADAPWHGHLARESQGRPGRALANSHGRDARVTHGQDAHATHGRDAHATPAASAAGQRDEAYAYDRLNRLVGTKRGILPSGTYQAPYPGDVTGNGVVDGSDSSVITANLNNSSRRWASGDLDGNGLVNSDDSAIYTANAGTPTGSVAAGRAWTLDATGNWSAYKQDNGDGQGGSADGDYADACDLDQSRDHNLANEIADGPDGDSYAIETTNGTAWADPVYDARGNMTTVPRPGDMTAVYTCTYDAWNRLVKVVAGQTTVAEYRYDGLNRRIRKYTDKSGDNWTVREYYYNVSWQTLQIDKETEDRTGGVEPAVADALNEQYVWSLRYVDAPILRDRETDDNPATGALGKAGSGLDERLYYCTDAQMNVTALVTAAGTVVERYAYDPYGQPIFYDGSWGSQTSSSHGNAILYGGYYFDAETGFYHVRNRMYHAQFGRWLTRDPLGYVDGMGLYEYCGSGPAGVMDPTGMAVIEIGLNGPPCVFGGTTGSPAPRTEKVKPPKQDSGNIPHPSGIIVTLGDLANQLHKPSDSDSWTMLSAPVDPEVAKALERIAELQKRIDDFQSERLAHALGHSGACVIATAAVTIPMAIGMTIAEVLMLPVAPFVPEYHVGDCYKHIPEVYELIWDPFGDTIRGLEEQKEQEESKLDKGKP